MEQLIPVTLPTVDIHVTIDGIVYQRNLSDDLIVDESHINDYLVRAPGLTAYWNSLHEKQSSIVKKTKIKLQRVAAELGTHYRKMARDDGRKISNVEVQEIVSLDPSYVALEDIFLDQQENELLLKSAVEAIRELRSTLISLSANMRHSGTVKAKTTEDAYLEKFRR